ncbi:MAG: amidohydrolase [Phycisphaerales bacterium]
MLNHTCSSLVFLASLTGPAGSLARAAGPLDRLDAIYPSLDALYIDLHQTPELSLREEKTAAKMAAKLRELGLEVTEKVGGWGVVGVLKNGPGPTVLLRADMDGLPVKEQTDLPYASTATGPNAAGEMFPTMHACGHDVHMTCWVGTAALLVASKSEWKGTVLFVGQPAEEVVAGARAMVADGLYTRFPKPDYCIGVHVTNTMPAGQIGVVSGPAYAASSSVDVTFYGRGGHGAMPHRAVDPIVIAARAVSTLQTLVSRETNPLDSAVVTVGTFHAGTKRNIIPDEAKIELTVRSYKPEVHQALLAGIARIAKAEAAAAGAPREPAVLVRENEGTEATVNDPALSARLSAALKRGLGDAAVQPTEPMMGSEDFGVFGKVAGAPGVQLRIGVIEPGVFARAKEAGRLLLLPGMHSPQFAPDKERTIRAATAAMTLSAMEVLGK